MMVASRCSLVHLFLLEGGRNSAQAWVAVAPCTWAWAKEGARFAAGGEQAALSLLDGEEYLYKGIPFVGAIWVLVAMVKMSRARRKERVDEMPDAVEMCSPEFAFDERTNSCGAEHVFRTAH
jgi:hypothetical protein